MNSTGVIELTISSITDYLIMCISYICLYRSEGKLEKRSYSRETRLVPFNTFNAEFEKQLPAHETYRSAFYAAEEKVGRYYTSYETFKSTRTQRRKRK